MYYVLYVGDGKEQHAENFIRSYVPEQFYSHCFHLQRHMKKKFRGSWCDSYSKLIPGYIFVESDQIEDFSEKAMKTLLPLKVLGMEKDREGEFFRPLDERETAWIKMLTPGSSLKDPDDMCYMVELSRVSIGEDGKVSILSGPLKHLQSQIKKFNLHKRIAEVEMDFMGNQSSLYLGIEF